MQILACAPNFSDGRDPGFRAELEVVTARPSTRAEFSLAGCGGARISLRASFAIVIRG